MSDTEIKDFAKKIVDLGKETGVSRYTLIRASLVAAVSEVYAIAEDYPDKAVILAHSLKKDLDGLIEANLYAITYEGE